jgi:hypothetical protein
MRDESAEVLHKRIEFAWPMCTLLPMDSDELCARNVLKVGPPIVTLREEPPKRPIVAEVKEDVGAASCPIP